MRGVGGVVLAIAAAAAAAAAAVLRAARVAVALDDADEEARLVADAAQVRFSVLVNDLHTDILAEVTQRVQRLLVEVVATHLCV